jgi:hypothetical protein
MPSISKIRFTNVVYEGGNKRYNDEVFLFDGHNGAILLENGGGKTVFIQTALQAVLPHQDLAERKIKDTLRLEDAPAHIAIEWILNERPRTYALTCVSLFLTKNGLDSYRYVYEYGENDNHSIEGIPFVKDSSGKIRAAERSEIQEYYSYMSQNYLSAKTFDTIKSYKQHLEQNYQIIPKEWESIVKINSAEGGVEHFFDECKTTGQLFDRLLIPTVEESLTSYQKNEFAETFEKHRASFKEYKQLKDKIAENERIKDKLESYVKVYEGLHDKKQAYDESKKLAKAYHRVAKKQEKELSQKVEEYNSAKSTWEQKNEHLQRKQDSYEVGIEKEKLDQLNHNLRQEEDEKERQQTSFNKADHMYYSLRLAEMRKNFHIEQEKKQQNEKQLRELDKEYDVEEIQESINQNESAIRGYFAELEESLTREKEELKLEHQSLETMIEKDTKEITVFTNEREQYVVKEAGLRAQVSKNNQNLKSIESEVLSNPTQESVEEQLPHWIKRYSELDEENMLLIQRNKALKENNKQLSDRLTNLNQEIQRCREQQTTIQAQKEQFDREHQMLKGKLAERKQSFSRIDSLYFKQASIEKQLLEDIERLSKEREQLLYRERLASRFFDDYGNQDSFYADRYLSEQVLQWQNQFSYLETGVSYIQSINHDVEDLIRKNPLWPITLVTTKDEVIKLEGKIHHISDRLQFPVMVISHDEASAFVQREPAVGQSSWIDPLHWKTATSQQQFVDWKNAQRNLAESAKEARQEKEAELQAWKQLQADVLEFFTIYPNATYKQLLEENGKIESLLFKLGEEVKLVTRTHIENGKLIDIQQTNQAENKEAMYGYSGKIEKGQKYVAIKKENKGLEEERLHHKNKMTDLDVRLKRLQAGLKNLVDEAKTIELDIRDRSNALTARILDNRLYQKVKHRKPVFTSKNIEILEDERESLLRELEQLSKGRGELVARIQASTDSMTRYEYDMNQLRNEKVGLDEELVFPLLGSEKMQELWSKRSALLVVIKELSGKVERLTSQYDTQVGKVENMMSKIEVLIEFTTNLTNVKDQLQEELYSLQNEKVHLDQQYQNLEKQQKDINAVLFEFEKYDIAHQFLEHLVEEVVLSNEEVTAFTYGRKKLVKEMTDQLVSSKLSLDKEKDIVEKAKGKYIDFCRSQIKDVRMKETAIQGIEKKQTYEEVLKYKELLQGRIQNGINYAEQHIRSHDKELEQFIIHVHTHIKRIADELKMIPKKTSVKVEDSWKEIFSFAIPEWNEHEGKADIRAHINWILEQLDREVYKDETGQEDLVKIKKDLEKWLQAKQLLQVVMKNQTMKVTCRKVTNDNKVTRGSYSWEQSNVWSGGEKWSKNMTLFLGMLNYIAEKRQHIQPKMKRHRTVIVDNPFGKASSDHVLNPVFFIAEQLGFQILALTAHAEGKFLRDYFPVIYSCRLRHAQGSDKQIMTKEKTIQHAYFQDHAPQSLERLGEVEQLTLF